MTYTGTYSSKVGEFLDFLIRNSKDKIFTLLTPGFSRLVEPVSVNVYHLGYGLESKWTRTRDLVWTRTGMGSGR